MSKPRNGSSPIKYARAHTRECTNNRGWDPLSRGSVGSISPVNEEGQGWTVADADSPDAEVAGSLTDVAVF